MGLVRGDGERRPGGAKKRGGFTQPGSQVDIGLVADSGPRQTYEQTPPSRFCKAIGDNHRSIKPLFLDLYVLFLFYSRDGQIHENGRDIEKLYLDFDGFFASVM